MKVILPLAKRGIVAGTVLSFARAMGEFGATLMLAGNLPGRTDTMPIAIYSLAGSGEWSTGPFDGSPDDRDVRRLYLHRQPVHEEDYLMGLQVRLQKKVNGFALDIEWQIGNELAVLFGFSGAGKSMTLQLIAGLMKPDKGQVSLDDIVYFDSSTGTDLPPQERPFGYVFQDLALFPHMTVLQNILYGAANLPKK